MHSLRDVVMVLVLNNILDNLWLHEMKGESGVFKGVGSDLNVTSSLSWDLWLLIVMQPYLMKVASVMCVCFSP